MDPIPNPAPMELRLQEVLEYQKNLIEAETGVRPDAIFFDDRGFADARQRGRLRPHYNTMGLDEAGARQLATRIAGELDTYVSRYDVRKFPPDVYHHLISRFGAPEQLTADDIRLALVWKYGHLGKPRIPDGHERLAREIWGCWPAVTRDLPLAHRDVFDCLYGHFGSTKRFVTVAFLTHLMFPNWVPIVDQHNFRAANHLMRSAIPAWPRPGPRLPSTWYDLEFLDGFMGGVLSVWPGDTPVPTRRELDLYLMMLGKAVKRER